MLTRDIIQVSLEIWGAIFCFVCAVILFLSRKGEARKNLVLMGALFVESMQLISDSFAVAFRGSMSTAGFYIVRVSNFLVFFFNYVLAVTLVVYAAELISGANLRTMKNWMYSIFAMGAVGTAVLVISQFTGFLYYFDENNIYHRADFYWVNMLVALFMIVATAIMLIRFRNNIGRYSYAALIIYLLLPIVAIVVQMFLYGVSLTNIANAIAMLILFGAHEAEKSEIIAQQERTVINQQAELSQARIDLLVSQIQPHFISNTLLTIQGLYNEESEKADEVMNSFIHYLQHSFSELSNNKPVSVASDINHSINYTNIVTQRWPDMNVEYRIECDSFCVPALTVQPLVENAVRHGLMPLESGGEVLVTAYETDDEYVLKVKDNGVGFDVNDPKPHYADNRNHIGLSNIRDRVRIMCGGTLEIKSERGKGTTATLKIPKEEEK